jgi:Sec-independent protein translocase protein TatA
MNIGGSELLIIAVLALLLFGPSLLAFWFGYILGQRKTEDVAPPSAGPGEPTERAQAEAAAAEKDNADREPGEEGTHD